MVTIGSLWLAILLSGILVWIASALIWTALPHHKTDYKGLPDEEAAVQALRPQNLPPGQYDFPHVASMAQMKEPEVVKRFDEGPVGFMTILPSGVPAMGRNMILSALYFLVVGFLVAYLTGRTVAPGADYLQVFRVSGTVAWLAYGWGIVPDAIWFGRPWSGVLKHLVDALVYALLTAGVFGWLWPG